MTWCFLPFISRLLAIKYIKGHLQRSNARKPSEQIATRSVGVNLTNSCPITCRHCISSCGPSLNTTIDPSNLDQWLDSLKQLSHIDQVCFTGGEPFFVYETLKKSIEISSGKGFTSTVITNGFWAKNLNRAELMIRELASKGLYSIVVSMDSYHQEHIPIKNIRNIIQLSKKHKLRVAISTINNNYPEVDTLAKEIYCALGRYALDVNDYYGAPLMNYPDNKLATNVSAQYNTLGICRSIGYIIQENGMVVSCCGPSQKNKSCLVVGDISKSTAGALYKSHLKSPIPLLLQVEGLRFLINLAKTKKVQIAIDDEVNLQNMCSKCVHLMENKSFQRIIEEEFADIDKRIEIALKYFIGYGDTAPLMVLLEEKAG